MRTEINGAVQSYVTYEHDDLNRITAVYDHDSAQVPVDPDTWFKHGDVDPTEMQYNPLGQMTSISRPNDVDTSYVYGDVEIIDPVTGLAQNPYQVYSILHEDTESTPVTLGQYDYSYDGANNRTGMDITASDGTPTNISYGYDRANRMISESYDLIGNAQSTTSYQYDRAGNRTQMRDSSGDITRYKYDENDQIERIDLPDYYFEEYLYDARGNLTSIQLKRDGVIDTPIGNPTLFEYNSRDLLSRIELPGTERIDYEYDYRGNRVRQEQVGYQDPTLYLWDEFSRWGDVVLEMGVDFSTGDLFSDMSYTLSNGMLISQTDYDPEGLTPDVTRYFLSDAQGTTRVMTDDTGAISSEYQYNAFGELDESIDSLSTETSYLYAGQQFDGYSELYSMRARYYDPTQGRFMTRDTWAYNYQNPFELNRYTYGANNPATFTDPSGHFVMLALKTLAVDMKARSSLALVGATQGALLGATIGGLYAAYTIALMDNDKCGGRSPFADNNARRDYILGSIAAGAFWGAVAGGAIGYGGLARIAAGVAISGSGIVGLTGSIFEAGTTFATDGTLNICAVSDGAMSLLAIVGGAAAVKSGYQQFQQQMLQVSTYPSFFFSQLQRILNKIPNGWTGSANKKKEGWRWRDPNNQNNGIRIDEGNPNSNWPSQQVDHVIINDNGRVIGRNGVPIQGSIKANGFMAHIPLSDWLNWRTWNQP